MRLTSLLATVIALMLPALEVRAAPCAGFNDVEFGSPFCANVEWLRNRGVTQGCTQTLYCPDQPVLRVQMAAFMNRLARVLTPEVLWVDSSTNAVDLDARPVICPSATYNVAAFPRRALLDLALAVQSSTTMDISADLVMSADGGATWTRLTALGNRGSAVATGWSNVANLAQVDLQVGQAVSFGVQMGRVSGAGDLNSSRCTLRVAIENRG